MKPTSKKNEVSRLENAVRNAVKSVAESTKNTVPFFISEEEFAVKEKELDSEIQTQIEVFSEREQESLRESFEAISAIKDQYVRRVLKKAFLQHLRDCEELLEDM